MGEYFAGRKTIPSGDDHLWLCDAFFAVVDRATLETDAKTHYLCVCINGNWFSFAGPNVNRVHDDFYVWAVKVLDLGEVDHILAEEREFLSCLDSCLVGTRAIRVCSSTSGKKSRSRRVTVEPGYVSHWDQVD